uniref:SRR1 domain containing n=1 Tax=Chelonoidis abingdonii TaxID=106734 RepID=A0A8C0GJ17_CHEAB
PARPAVQPFPALPSPAPGRTATSRPLPQPGPTALPGPSPPPPLPPGPYSPSPPPQPRAYSPSRPGPSPPQPGPYSLPGLSIPSPSRESACKSGHLRCVCYGIGSFSSCVISRYQLAFLLLLLEKLQIPKSQCYIFDPLFSELEISVLNDLSVTVVLENEEGKHHIHEFTIFYMIHCGKALYNNLLWSNWSVDALSKMIIIGNSFKGIEERLLARILERDYLYIAKVQFTILRNILDSHLSL